jgi:hypothetical protein
MEALKERVRDINADHARALEAVAKAHTFDAAALMEQVQGEVEERDSVPLNL